MYHNTYNIGGTYPHIVTLCNRIRITKKKKKNEQKVGIQKYPKN